MLIFKLKLATNLCNCYETNTDFNKETGKPIRTDP